jgi:WD40 repeat protein
VAIGGENNVVYTFDTETGAAVNSFTGHNAAISSLSFTSGGNIISTAADKTTIVWNTSPLWTLERTIGTPDGASPIMDRVTAIGFSPDGSLVATGSGEPSRTGELKIWKVADGTLAQEIKEPHSDSIYDVEFSPDGKHIASCGADRFMKVFNLADGQLHRSYEGHTHHVLGVAWRADGRMLASSGADNVVKVWNFLTGDQVRTIQGFSKEVTSITFAGNDSQVLASSGDRSVQMKNAENGGNVRSFAGAQDFVYSVDVSADGKTIVAGTADGVVLVWNDQGQAIATFAPPQPVTPDATAAK